MKHVKHEEIVLEKVDAEGAKNCMIRWLIGEKDGAHNFSMRMFEVGVQGNTPLHTHWFEHEVFVLEGAGIFKTKDGETKMRPYDVIFVNADIEHQFLNAGDTVLKFLCSIPNEMKPIPSPKINPFSEGKANNC